MPRSSRVARECSKVMNDDQQTVEMSPGLSPREKAMEGAFFHTGISRVPS